MKGAEMGLEWAKTEYDAMRATYAAADEAATTMRDVLAAEPGPWKYRDLEDKTLARANLGRSAVRAGLLRLIDANELVPASQYQWIARTAVQVAGTSS
jgi:hypothetical protein